MAEYKLTPEQQKAFTELGNGWKIAMRNPVTGVLVVRKEDITKWIQKSGKVEDYPLSASKIQYTLTPEQQYVLDQIGPAWKVQSQTSALSLWVLGPKSIWLKSSGKIETTTGEELKLEDLKALPLSPTSNLKLTDKQTNTIKMLGGKVDEIKQFKSGHIWVRIKSRTYEISPSGMTYDTKTLKPVEEKKIKKPKKKYDEWWKTESSSGYGSSSKLTKRQEEEFAKLGKLARINEYLSGGRVAFEMNNDYYLMSPKGNLSPDVWMQQEQARLKGTGGQLALPPASTYTYVPPKTICQENPERCKPRQIEHVFFDADNTIWDLNGTAANVTGKLKKIDDNTVVELDGGKHEKSLWEYDLAPEIKQESESVLDMADELMYGMSAEDKKFLLSAAASQEAKPKPESEPKENVRNTIKLFPSFRQTLDELDKRGIKSSIISLNTPDSVKRILKEFGLLDRFAEVRDSYTNKGQVFKELTKKLNVCPCASIFVDDYTSNIKDVANECGLALQIGKNKDISEPIEILKFIKD